MKSIPVIIILGLGLLLTTLPAQKPNPVAKLRSQQDTKLKKITNLANKLKNLSQVPVQGNFTTQQVQEIGRYNHWLKQASANVLKFVHQWKVKFAQFDTRYPGQVKPASSQSSSSMGNSTGQAATQSGDPTAKLMEATRKVQEMNQTFNSEYTDLQQNILKTNRQFYVVQKIASQKHSSARNVINEVR